MKRIFTGVNANLIKLVGFSCLLAAIFGGGFFALGKVNAAESFVQGFNSQVTLQPGMVVSVSKSSDRSVEPTPHNQTGRIYGVVIDPSDAAVTVGSGGQKTFVANSGQYPVLVSSENGVIKSGDYLSMSATDGLATKATADQAYVLGRALEGFDGKNKVLTTTSNNLAIGKILVDINATKNPLVSNDVAVPAPLKRVGEAIAGKNVTAIRLYSALVVLSVTLIIAASLLWVGVKSGMTAIGRNPLSKHSILRSLMQVLAIDVLIFIIGLFGVYLLLRA